MDVITSVLVVLLAVATSGFRVRLSPFNLQLPVVQIAVGPTSFIG